MRNDVAKLRFRKWLQQPHVSRVLITGNMAEVLRMAKEEIDFQLSPCLLCHGKGCVDCDKQGAVYRFLDPQ